MAVAVAVPRHRVAVIAVEVESDGVEGSVVPTAQRSTDFREEGERFGHPVIHVPPTAEPRLVDDRVVHRNAGALTELEPIEKLVEDPVGAAQPFRRVVDPGGSVEIDPLDRAEIEVGRWITRTEQ